MAALIPFRLRRWLLSGLMAMSTLIPLTAQAAAEPLFVPFEGAGNVSVFNVNPATGSGNGGWVGSIDQVAPPVVALPLSLVSVVLFNYNAMTQLLSGSFEFTTSDNLMSTLFGTLTGNTTDANILVNGGQFAIDYLITGGTGAFADANGFGLSFLTFNPAGTFNNYTESGLLLFTVPLPGTLALVLAALLVAGTIRTHDARRLRTRLV